MTKKEKAQAELLARHLRSLEVGKAGYKDADAALDEYIQAGGPIDHPLTLRTGETATVVDQFANRNRVSSGLSVRRYQVEVERARAITGKLWHVVQFVRLDMEKSKDRDKLEFEVGRARLAFESHMLFLRPVVDRTRIGKESYDSEPEPTKETWAVRVALYARVSTRQHGQDVETQLQALRIHAKQKKWTITDIYADRGWSGSKERRPELDRLMLDASRRKFDAVLVARFDRFARSVKHLIQALETFQALGVHFISLSESIDTSTPMGKMIFTVLAAVAELERALIRERVQMGVDRAKRDGKKLGRPRKSIVEDSTIQRQIEKGESISAIAREWNIARSTVRCIARRYTGKKRKAPKRHTATKEVRFTPSWGEAEGTGRQRRGLREAHAGASG